MDWTFCSPKKLKYFIVDSIDKHMASPSKPHSEWRYKGTLLLGELCFYCPFGDGLCNPRAVTTVGMLYSLQMAGCAC